MIEAGVGDPPTVEDSRKPANEPRSRSVALSSDLATPDPMPPPLTFPATPKPSVDKGSAGEDLTTDEESDFFPANQEEFFDSSCELATFGGERSRLLHED